MTPPFRRSAGALLALALSPLAMAAEPDTRLPDVVVTAPPATAPLTVETDPRQPHQPVPAHDGADYLKAIPGFSVIRKGGTDGDPVFRGMAGSRLNILLDGEQILGGCGGRMDPPTAYVFPASYDRITVLKGPQSVLHGPGSSAGTVLFERDSVRRTDTGMDGRVSLTGGSFGRNDQVVNLNGGSSDYQLRLDATRTQADDYEDGNGIAVHSQYERWSGDMTLGWTPDDDTLVELSWGLSDGEAAYRDRGMDGVEFARENMGLRAVRENLSDAVKKVEVQAWQNYIDHVMDNYTLRTFMPSVMMPAPAVSNPDRLTLGGRISAEFAVGGEDKLALGVDAQENEHTLRMSMNQPMMPYQAMARRDDASFSNQGVFGEYTHVAGDSDRIIGGARADRWNAEDLRAATMTAPAPSTGGSSRSDTLESGFLRHEHDYSDSDTVYAGIGHAQRFPDYWELIGQGKQSMTTDSAFLTRPEQVTQLDIGWLRTTQDMQLSLSLFANEMHDYILIDNVSKSTPMMAVTVVRNVDATSFGGEAGARWNFTGHWNADATLAWVRGDNETDKAPLAQLPPLEARLGLGWDNGTWSAGSLLRLVDRQDRVDPGKGNIVGQDIGATPGFAVFSLNGGWQPRDDVQLAVGVDNVFDIDYAEHISRSGGAMVSGFVQTTRVNEPGRNIWLTAEMRF
jgi:iron complex outermembrane receptor protein